MGGTGASATAEKIGSVPPAFLHPYPPRRLGDSVQNPVVASLTDLEDNTRVTSFSSSPQSTALIGPPSSPPPPPPLQAPAIFASNYSTTPAAHQPGVPVEEAAAAAVGAEVVRCRNSTANGGAELGARRLTQRRPRPIPFPSSTAANNNFLRAGQHAVVEAGGQSPTSASTAAAGATGGGMGSHSGFSRATSSPYRLRSRRHNAGVGRNVDTHVYLNTKVMSYYEAAPSSTTPSASTTMTSLSAANATPQQRPGEAMFICTRGDGAGGRGTRVVEGLLRSPLSDALSGGGPTDSAQMSPSSFSVSLQASVGAGGATTSPLPGRVVGPTRVVRRHSIHSGGRAEAADPSRHAAAPPSLQQPQYRVHRYHTATAALWNARTSNTLSSNSTAGLRDSPETGGCLVKRPPIVSSVKDVFTATSPSVSSGLLDRSPASPPLRPTFALFGVLERLSRFAEFSQLYMENAELEPFLRRVTYFISTTAAAGQKELLRWHQILMFLLCNPEECVKVGNEFFNDSVNSWPLHMLYLTCCFYVTARSHGYGQLLSALRTGGILSSGKGLFAALAVAMARNEEELARSTALMYRAAFYTGVLMRRQRQQLESESYQNTSGGYTLLVVNIPIFTLRQLVDRVNEGYDVFVPMKETGDGVGSGTAAASCDVGASSPRRPHHSQSSSTPPQRSPHSVIEVSRVISSRSAVLCGHPLDLLRLDMILARFADFNGVKIHKEYLPAGGPENSSFYNKCMAHDLLALWAVMGISFSLASIQLPVFSPVNGDLWRDPTSELLFSGGGCESGAISSSSLQLPASTYRDDWWTQQIAEAATCANQDLTYSLRHVKDGSVLLDFSTHAVGIGRLIAWTNKSITVLAAPENRMEVSAMPPPRRSSKDEVVQGTMEKMAVINDILRAVSQSLSSPPDSLLQPAVELSTTFAELGLLEALPHAVPSSTPSPTHVVSIHDADTPPSQANAQSTGGPAAVAAPFHTPSSTSGVTRRMKSSIGGGGDSALSSGSHHQLQQLQSPPQLLQQEGQQVSIMTNNGTYTAPSSSPMLVSLQDAILSAAEASQAEIGISMNSFPDYRRLPICSATYSLPGSAPAMMVAVGNGSGGGTGGSSGRGTSLPAAQSGRPAGALMQRSRYATAPDLFIGVSPQQPHLRHRSALDRGDGVGSSPFWHTVNTVDLPQMDGAEEVCMGGDPPPSHSNGSAGERGGTGAARRGGGGTAATAPRCRRGLSPVATAIVDDRPYGVAYPATSPKTSFRKAASPTERSDAEHSVLQTPHRGAASSSGGGTAVALGRSVIQTNSSGSGLSPRGQNAGSGPLLNSLARRRLLNPSEMIPLPLYDDDFVIRRNSNYAGIVNVYQVSSLIKYYEMQFNCVLCDGAVLFAERLKRHTGFAFPLYTLLLCPTVFSLLELWDGIEFVQRWRRAVGMPLSSPSSGNVIVTPPTPTGS